MRAEAAGMLASSLGMLQKHTNFYFPMHMVKYMVDVEGLIQKEVEHLTYADPYTNVTI